MCQGGIILQRRRLLLSGELKPTTNHLVISLTDCSGGNTGLYFIFFNSMWRKFLMRRYISAILANNLIEAVKLEEEALWARLAGDKRTCMRLNQYNYQNVDNIVRVGTCPTLIYLTNFWMVIYECLRMRYPYYSSLRNSQLYLFWFY